MQLFFLKDIQIVSCLVRVADLVALRRQERQEDILNVSGVKRRKESEFQVLAWVVEVVHTETTEKEEQVSKGITHIWTCLRYMIDDLGDAQKAVG